MANQNSNDAFTPIPNTLLEQLAKQHLSGSEFKVLLVVLRKTIGFHKEEDVISLTQFQKATNLPRWTVWQAIEKLVSKTLLVRKTLLSGSIYRLNKDFETWKASKQNITSKENITRASKEKPTRVVSKTLHTKESIKETIQKKNTLGEPNGIPPKPKQIKPTNPEVKTFIDWYSDRFLSIFSERPVISGGKDGVTVKGLLNAYGLERLKELAEAFFNSDDEFISKAGYSLGIFKTQINKLLSGGQREDVPKGWYNLKKFMEAHKNDEDQDI